MNCSERGEDLYSTCDHGPEIVRCLIKKRLDDIFILYIFNTNILWEIELREWNLQFFYPYFSTIQIILLALNTVNYFIYLIFCYHSCALDSCHDWEQWKYEGRKLSICIDSMHIAKWNMFVVYQ